MWRILSVALFLSAPVVASELRGPAVVTDGDTLRIVDTRIRLFAIDAPEGKQSCSREGLAWLCGQEASKYLRELVGAETLTCEEKDRDRYGRTVAICHLPDGRDIGAEMVAAGMALAYRRYGGSMYDSAETEAKIFTRGLWSGTFQPPWEWRREQSSKRRSQ